MKWLFVVLYGWTWTWADGTVIDNPEKVHVYAKSSWQYESDAACRDAAPEVAAEFAAKNPVSQGAIAYCVDDADFHNTFDYLYSKKYH